VVNTRRVIMRKQALLFALALMLGSGVVLSTGSPAPDVANAAGNGKGGGGAGGDGVIPDYGDLIILHRDEFGVPIPSPAVQVTNPETGELVDGGLCWQPIAVSAPEDYGVDLGNGLRGVPVDQYTCGVLDSTYTQEVDFGRINQARSPVTVFESQLEDVVIKLATAYSTSLDPAGRMVASTCGVDEMLVPSTIDSPLQNLAIYRQLMLTGAIGPALPAGAGPVETAARGLGVASDKGGEVNVDMVAYLNQIMGLTDPATSTILPKLSETYREEVQGVIQPVTKYFLNYGANGYGYNRGNNFGALPSTGHIGGPGQFEYLDLVPGTGVPLDTARFFINQGSITTAVFADEPFTGGNIGAFAQAADDTRAVINFMHDWPMPDADVYGTPLGSCTPDPTVITYDVSISDVSGLQVPKMMVDGSEGREFFLTVANAGPDPASGTVQVEATAANGGIIVDSPWNFTFTGLPAGGSQTWITFFNVDLGGPTTIEWTATATAEYDVNLSNNTVIATTSVKVTGGGGGGGRP
jgi:hypothetical protein